MPDNDIASQWASFEPERKKRLLARMSPEQKSSLRKQLEGAGHTAQPAAVAPAPAPEPAATPRSLLQRVSDAFDRAAPNVSAEDLAAHPLANATAQRGAELLRPVANVISRGVRDLGHLPEGIANLHPIDAAVQGVKDNLHPIEAMRRSAAKIQANAQAAAQPYDPQTRTGVLQPGQLPAVKTDDVTDLLGDAGAQLTLAEAGGAGLRNAAEVVGSGMELASGQATPGRLRRAAQTITGVGQQAVQNKIGKAAEETVAKDAEVAAGNQELTEQRQRRQQIQQRVQQRTAALGEKQQAIKVAETAKNNAKWDALRGKTQGAMTDLGPVKAAVQVAKRKMDPNGEKLFGSIVKEGVTAAPAEERMDFRELYNQFYPNGPEGTPGAPSYADFYQNNTGEPLPLDEGEGGLVGFDRLQRWYSYLGDKMYGAGGNMEGGTYDALKHVRGAIDTAMQGAADSVGAGDDLADARQSHQNLMEAFSDSPAQRQTVATKNLQDANPEEFRRQQEAERTGRIARYDPTYQKDFDALRGDHETLKAFPSEDAIRNRLQAPPDAPEMSLKQVREDLLKTATKKWSDISQYKIRRLSQGVLGGLVGLASGFAGGGVEGGLAGYGITNAAGFVASEFAPNVVSTILNKPAVIEWLTKPTIEDIETISKIPGRDRVKVTDALGLIAEERARAGKPVAIAPEVQKLLGGQRMLRIQAAQRLLPANAGEAKARAAEVAGGEDSPMLDVDHTDESTPGDEPD